MATNRQDSSKSMPDDYNIADMLRAHRIIEDSTITDQTIPIPTEQAETDITVDSSLQAVTTKAKAASLEIITADTDDLEEPLPFWGNRSSDKTEDKSDDFWSPWLLILVGILGGSILTLLILQGLNGTLVLNNQSQVQTLAEEISILDSQNDDLNAEISGLKSQIIDLTNARILSTEVGVTQLETELDTIKKQADTLSTQVTFLEGTLGNLIVMNEGASVKTNEATIEIQTLQTQVNEAHSQITTLQSSNENLQTSVQDLQSNIENLNQVLALFRDFVLSIDESPKTIDSEN